MTTAEYSVGTLGAVVVAGVLLRLVGGDGGWLVDVLKNLIGTALDPTRLLEHLVHDGPFTGILP